MLKWIYFPHHIAKLFQRTNYVFAESTKHFLNVMNEIILKGNVMKIILDLLKIFLWKGNMNTNEHFCKIGYDFN